MNTKSYIEVTGINGYLHRTRALKLITCTFVENTLQLVRDTLGNNYYLVVLRGQQMPELHDGDVLVLERLYYSDKESDVYTNTDHCFWLLITDDND